MSSDPIGLAGGIRPQSYVADPVNWVDPLGLDKVIIRYLSKEEAKAIKSNKGFVGIIGSNKKPSNKAIWVNDGSNFNPSKEKYRVKVTLNDKGAEIMDNTKDIGFSGETGSPNDIITKTNEPGAKGIGRNKVNEVNEVNENIKNIEYETCKKGKWTKCGKKEI